MDPMSLFRREPSSSPKPPDPKDEMIAAQRDEIAYLRGKVDQLQNQLLALHSASAYRLLNNDTIDALAMPPGSPLPTPFRNRAEVYQPKFSLHEKEKEMAEARAKKEES